MKHEAKMLKEREEGRGRGLRIEDRDQEWKERENHRAFDEKRGRSRADRGERVRRSERRHAKEIEVLEDPYLTEEEEKSVQRISHHSGERGERVRRKDRRRSHNGDAQEEEWKKEEKQKVRQREKEKYNEEEEYCERKEGVKQRKKVAGKNISSKYGRSGRESDTNSQQNSRYEEAIDRLTGESYERREKPQYRRSQRRPEVLRPVDFGYEPDIIGD